MCTCSHTHIGNNSRWNTYVLRRAHHWREMIENWVISAKARKHRVLVVMYEDLKNNEVAQIKRMLNFLHVNYSIDVLKTRLSQNFTDSFHRKHGGNEGLFEPYTGPQKAHVLNIISQTQKKLEHHNLTSVLNVNRYLAKYDINRFLTKLHELGSRT